MTLLQSVPSKHNNATGCPNIHENAKGHVLRNMKMIQSVPNKHNNDTGCPTKHDNDKGCFSKHENNEGCLTEHDNDTGCLIFLQKHFLPVVKKADLNW